MITCKNCGTPNPATSKFCEKCGNPLFAPPTPTPSMPPAIPKAPSDEDMAKKIRQAVHGYIKDHYRLSSISDKTAQLIRPKKIEMWFSVLFLVGLPLVGGFIATSPSSFLIGIVVIGLGQLLFLLQLAYYLARRDDSVYLFIDSDGAVGTISYAE